MRRAIIIFTSALVNGLLGFIGALSTAYAALPEPIETAADFPSVAVWFAAFTGAATALKDVQSQLKKLI